MNVPTRLGAFALALGVVFATAYGAGALAGPVAAGRGGDQVPGGQTGAGHEAAGGHNTEQAPASGPGGLAVSAGGYSLRPLSAAPVAGQPGEFSFQIIGPDGSPATGFRASHDKQLHLIVVRRDLTGFQHLHPQPSADGTWHTPLTLAAAGDWRVFADFLPEGRDRLAYLHVHPRETIGAGPTIAFDVEVPTAGAYRLFLDFQHSGMVRTAPFTAIAT